MVVDLICLNCKHFRPIDGGCDAFPDGIPYDLTEGIVLTHDEPFEGQDNDIVFEPIEE